MDSSERGPAGEAGMGSRNVHVLRAASSSSDSSGIRTRSGSDATGVSGESGNSSSRRDGSENTSLEDEEDDNAAGDSNADEAKIADTDFNDEHCSPSDDAGPRIVYGDHEDGEGAGTGTGANARIGQLRQKTTERVHHTTEISAMKQASPLIRSVEIDATCLWDGVGQNQPVTDIRIVMMVCIMTSPPRQSEPIQ